MLCSSMAKATRHKHLQTILNLTRYLKKDWDAATANDIGSLVVEIVRRYANDNGQETYTSYDHKKILKIFFRWIKLGSREFREFYHRLSKYEHSSPKELERTIKQGIVHERFVHYFDQEMFTNCAQLTTKVLDWCFYFIVKTYPNTIPILKSKENLEYWIDKLQYNRTKQLMNS